MKQDENAAVRLTVAKGAEAGSTFNFNCDPIKIGRHPENMVVLSNPFISAKHGEIFRRDGEYVYEDLVSTNGSCIVRGDEHIYLNRGMAFRSPVLNGDQLYLGLKKEPVILDLELILPVRGGVSVSEPQILDSMPADELDQSRFGGAFFYHAFTILNQLSKELNTAVELSKALDTIGKALISMFPHSTHVVILLLNRRKGRFIPVFSKKKDGGCFVSDTIQLSNTILRYVLERKETVLFADAGQAFEPSQSISSAHLQSGICTPLRRSHGLNGLIVVENRENPGAFDRRDMEVLTFLAHQTSMIIDRISLYNELHDTFEQTIRGLVTALEAKDEYTHGHSEKVAQYCKMIAAGMGLPASDSNLIVRASLMHDIGKIGVQYSVLNKQGKLTEEEFKQVKNHPVVGKRIIKPIKFLKNIVPIVYHHHERYDGTGYPEGKKGEAIPLGARILAVADTYHAMTSDRAYRKRRTHDEAIEELKRNAGTQFDPKVVEVFVREMEQFFGSNDTSNRGEGKGGKL